MSVNVRRLQFALAGYVLAMGGGVFGQVIRVDTQSMVEAKQDVRLGDIATVSGVDPRMAEQLSNTVIISSIDGPRTIKAESILLALMSQNGNLRNLQISGSAACALTLGGGNATVARKVSGMRAEEVPVMMAAVSGNRSPEDPPSSITSATTQKASDSLTLMKVIVARVEQELNAAHEDVRVRAETISPLLDAPVAANRKWLCRPLTRTLLGTVQFEAQLVEGPRVVEKLNVQTKVEKRQMVVVAMGRLERGDVVATNNVRMEETWLDRKLPTLFTSDKEVVGLEAQRAVDVGATMDQRDFKPALMTNKGDPVNVVYISGTLKVQIRGRAMEEGKLHDQVEVRNEMTGERYQAYLIGKRLAVVGGTLDAAEEQKLREAR